MGVGYLVLVLALTVFKMDFIGGASSAPPDKDSPGDPPPSVAVLPPSPPTPTVDPTPTVRPTPSSPPRTTVSTRRPAPAPPKRTTPAATTTRARPPVVTSYEAESWRNGLTDTRIYTCSGCSGGKKVGNIGADMGRLTFNGVTAATHGTATVTLVYINGDDLRAAQLSVNGGEPISLAFPGTGGWSTVGRLVVRVTLRSGSNTLTLYNPTAPAPDFDKITVSVPAG